MQAFTTLLRRTAVALGAIAATTVIGQATAQSITLSGATGNTCTYSAMTVNPSGNFTVTCTSSSSPGVFSLTAPTSLAISSTSTSGQVRINRSGGSTGAAEVGFTLSGTNNCTSADSSVSFADGDLAFKTITINTGGSPGTCIVRMESPSVGSLTGTNPRTIQVVDPNADVTFEFSDSNPLSASVGGGAVPITVLRGGGTANSWTVPISLAPSVGTLSAASLTFGAGSSSAQVSYTPPATTPSSPALPVNLTLTLGTPTGGASGQNATLGDATHTFTLNGPAVGCPVPETSASTIEAAFASGTTLLLPSGVVKTFVLPSPKFGKTSGEFWMSAGTSTFPVGTPYFFEVHINKCKGLVQKPATADLCYGTYSTKTGTWSRKWYTALIPGNTSYDTIADIKLRGCWAPPSEGPWYVNIRYTYPSCDPKIGAMCGWNYQWKNGTY